MSIEILVIVNIIGLFFVFILIGIMGWLFLSNKKEETLKQVCKYILETDDEYICVFENGDEYHHYKYND